MPSEMGSDRPAWDEKIGLACGQRVGFALGCIGWVWVWVCRRGVGGGYGKG